MENSEVQVDSQYFAFDYVYGGSTSSPSSALYDDCVSPLADALFNGHNATVLAYGQVLLDEVNDLLVPNLPKGAALLKLARVPIQTRKTVNGITVAGVTETEVRTKEEMAKHLSHGAWAQDELVVGFGIKEPPNRTTSKNRFGNHIIIECSILKLECLEENENDNGYLNKEGHKNDLRNQGYKSSSRSEDMDTSETEYLDDSDDDDWAPKSEKEEKLYCCSCSIKSSCKTMRCPCRASGGSCGTSSACVSRKCANSRTVKGGSPEFQIHEFPPD
nr:kinesin-like protein kin-4c [Quercus suber]